MQDTKDALILAAGLGSRLSAVEGHKILANVGGRPMLDHHISGLESLGVERLTVVVGHAHEELVSVLESWPSPIEISWVYNPQYRLSNGISVLAGADFIWERGGRSFWLLMSDHLFEPQLFEDLRHACSDMPLCEGMLAIDRKLDTIYDMPDATKLLIGPELSIGKDIPDFDVVDAGLFWCGEGFVQALRDQKARVGDCSTSDAVKILSAAHTFQFWDIGDRTWQDVDTPGAREHAEKLLECWGANRG